MEGSTAGRRGDSTSPGPELMNLGKEAKTLSDGFWSRGVNDACFE